jgi:hypothetical protein
MSAVHLSRVSSPVTLMLIPSSAAVRVLPSPGSDVFAKVDGDLAVAGDTGGAPELEATDAFRAKTTIELTALI